MRRQTASPAAKQRPAAAPAAAPRAVQIRIASPVCAPRPHVHHHGHGHHHAAPAAALVAGGTRLDFSSPPGADKAKDAKVVSPPRANVAQLIASLGVYSPRPGVIIAPSMEAASSPVVELAAAESERAALAAALAARSETAAALSAQAAAQSEAVAARASAAETRARADAAAEVAAAREASLSAERDAALEELRSAAEECASVRAALLTQEVSAENALFKADELAASLADAAAGRAASAAKAAALRDTLRAALDALAAEPVPPGAGGDDALAQAAALAEALCFAAADAAAELATLRNTVANAGFSSAPSSLPASAATAAAPGIRVVARVRPARAGAAGGAWAAAAPGGADDGGDAVVTGSGSDASSAVQRRFAVDRALGPDASQAQVFAEVAPLVDAALKGHAACVFAFGQTASGKTHTMLGSGALAASASAEAGVLQRALAALFEGSASGTTVKISMLEVYNDAVRDLLAPGGAPARLAIRHAGGSGRAAAATEVAARTVADAAAAVARGAAARRSAPTAANAASSRSHLLVGLALPASGGRLWLVDLAGSERATTASASAATLPPALAACHSAPLLSFAPASSAAAAEGERLREGGCINRSLCALVDCVAALARNAPHVPWRNSKLTELLSECLGAGGKGGALLIAHVSPCVGDAAETGATLAFAERARGAAPRPARRASIDPKAEKWRAAAAVAAAERDAALAAAKAAQDIAAAATKRAMAADAAAASARRDAAKARGLSMGTSAGAGGGRPSLAAADVQAILTTPFGAARSTAASRRASMAPTPAPALAAERSAPARLFYPCTPGATAEEEEDAPLPPLALGGAEPRSAVKAPRRPLGPAACNGVGAEPSADFDARVKAAARRASGADELHARAASAPARRGRHSTGGAGLAMLSGASRVCVTPGSRTAALLAKAAEPEKPQPKWSARW